MDRRVCPSKQTRETRKSQIRPPEVIQKLAGTPRAWMRQVQGTESRYYRAIGSAEALMAKAAELLQTSMKGVAGERALQILRERPT